MAAAYVDRTSWRKQTLLGMSAMSRCCLPGTRVWWFREIAPMVHAGLK
jgi:hypothetical protein